MNFSWLKSHDFNVVLFGALLGFFFTALLFSYKDYRENQTPQAIRKYEVGECLRSLGQKEIFEVTYIGERNPNLLEVKDSAGELRLVELLPDNAPMRDGWDRVYSTKVDCKTGVAVK